MVDYLVKSKLNELFLATKLSLNPVISDFKSKLRSYFSKQHSEVIKNINKGNFNFGVLFDIDKSTEKLVKIYKSEVDTIISKSIKRCESETEEDVDETLHSFIKDNYITNYIPSIVSDIQKTTLSNLMKFYGEFLVDDDLELLKQKVNKYFDKTCKSYRVKVISTTEVYRTFNFYYFNYMSSKGYYKKVFVSGNIDKTSSIYPVNYTMKYYLEEWELPLKNLKCLFPPIHPNDCSTIFMIKD